MINSRHSSDSNEQGAVNAVNRLLVGVLAALVLGFSGLTAIPQSSEAYYLPRVSPKLAEQQTYRLLRTYPGWRYRDYGFVDCRNGRISRASYACRFGYQRGSRCSRGRVRTVGFNDGFERFYRSFLSGYRYDC